MNSRLAQYLETVRAVWAWWLGELAMLIPASLRSFGRPAKHPVDIWALPGETRIERVSDGVGERLADPRSLDALDDDAWAEMAALIGDQAARLILTPPDIYAAPIQFPRQIGRRMAQAAELQLEEVAPLRPELLHWTLGHVRSADDKLHTELVMVRADRVESLVNTFAERGLAPPSIWAAPNEKPVLLKTMREAEFGLWSRRHAWLIAMCLLASIPITTVLIANGMAWNDERIVTELQDDAHRILRAESHARRIEAIRTDLVPLAKAMPLSHILDDLAGRLPKEASLIEASRDLQGRVELIIEASDPDTVRDALAHDRLFKFEEVNETTEDSGAMRLTYRGRSR